MSHPLVIAYHLIWMAYGWWLPNDPRGSMSRTIRNDVFADLGALHYGRKRLQPTGRVIRTFYEGAADFLKYPLRTFTPAMMACVAKAFGAEMAAQRYTCWACATMPDHVHLVIRKHKHQAEEMIANLQRASHLLLRERGHFDLEHPVWGGPGWKVFLDHPDDVWRTISYVEQNPVKVGLPRQVHPFVKPYDNWPLHEGHSPNSPYARRLRLRGPDA